MKKVFFFGLLFGFLLSGQFIFGQKYGSWSDVTETPFKRINYQVRYSERNPKNENLYYVQIRIMNEWNEPIAITVFTGDPDGLEKYVHQDGNHRGFHEGYRTDISGGDEYTWVQCCVYSDPYRLSFLFESAKFPKSNYSKVPSR